MANLNKPDSIETVVRTLSDRPPEELAFKDDSGEEGFNDDHIDLDQPDTQLEGPTGSVVTRWRVAKALMALRAQVDAAAPRRKKGSDGTIGDERHCGNSGGTSDHCARISHAGVGIVTAMDLTHDPDNGCDAHAIGEAIRKAKDPRVKYIISNARIASSYTVGRVAPWVWRAYSGANPHNKHCHISVLAEPGRFDDTSIWVIN